MADKKISALTAASTPLAGTEVLPIVQSGSTVKVAVSDLTAGRAVSMASGTVTGDLTVDTNTLYANSTANEVCVGTTTSINVGKFNVKGDATHNGVSVTPHSNAYYNYYGTNASGAVTFYVDGNGFGLFSGGIETNAASTFKENFVQGTAAKGVNFTANANAPGMTSELLNWYEEGTWTPTLGGSTADPTGVSYAAQTGRYTRVGRTVTVSGLLGFTTYTGGTGDAIVRGLPFTVNATVSGIGGVLLEQITFSAGYTSVASRATSGTAFVDVMQVGTGVGWIPLPLANAASSATGKYIQFTVTYEV